MYDFTSTLSQVLNDGSANAIYGMDRLLTDDGSAETWYLGDALGSVRATLDGAGTVQGTVGYDPWGAPQGDLLGAFGFTGELQDDTSGLVHLRARWYDPGSARFTTRDPFAGFPETPYSLHPYQYAYSNPVMYRDPTGKAVQGSSVQLKFERSSSASPSPILPNEDELLVCENGTIILDLIDQGLLGGAVIEQEATFGYSGWGGEEVWNLLTFETALFSVRVGKPELPVNAGAILPFSFGLDTTLYWGSVTGWSNRSRDQWTIEAYGGPFYLKAGVGIQTPFDLASVNFGYAVSLDGTMSTAFLGSGLGINFNFVPFSFQEGYGEAYIRSGSIRRYRSGKGGWPTRLDGILFAGHFLISPASLVAMSPIGKAYGLYVINHNAEEWQRYQDWLDK